MEVDVDVEAEAEAEIEAGDETGAAPESSTTYLTWRT